MEKFEDLSVSSKWKDEIFSKITELRALQRNISVVAKIWKTKLTLQNRDIFELYEHTTLIALQIFEQVFPSAYTPEIEDILNINSQEIKGQFTSYETTNPINNAPFIVKEFFIDESSKKSLDLDKAYAYFSIQHELIFTILDSSRDIYSTLSLKESFDRLNKILQNVRKKLRLSWLNYHTFYPSSFIDNLYKEIISTLESFRSDIFYISYARNHKNSLSKSTILSGDYSFSEESETTSKTRLENSYYKERVMYECSYLVKDYVGGHQYFLANKQDPRISKNRSGFNIVCAILCKKLIKKGWLVSTLGAREQMRFCEEELNIIVRAHHQFSRSEAALEEEYPDLWKLFDDLPTPLLSQ